MSTTSRPTTSTLTTVGCCSLCVLLSVCQSVLVYVCESVLSKLPLEVQECYILRVSLKVLHPMMPYFETSVTLVDCVKKAMLF